MSRARAVEALDYASPPCILAYCATLALISAIKIRPSEKKKNSQDNASRVLPLLLWLTSIAYLGEAIALSIHRFVYNHDIAQDQLLHALACALIWFALAISKTTSWLYYLGSAAIALAFEIALISLFRHNLSSSAVINKISVAFLVLKLCFLTAVVALGLLLVQRRPNFDEEHEPLLNGHPKGNSANKGLEDDDDGSYRRNAFIKKKQQERLEEAGDLWSYIKPYSVFLPYVIPKKNRKIQLCMVVTVTCLIVARFLNILVPRQLGIITDKLIDSEFQQPPYREVAIYMVYSTLQTAAGLSLIQNLATLPLEMYTRQRITTAAFDQVMGLSMDFHDDKDSAEIMRAIDQGMALTDILDVLVTVLVPAFIDIFVSFWYFSYLFGLYASFMVVVGFAAYLALDIKSTTWLFGKRRIKTKTSREESRVKHQAMQNWTTAQHFNRNSYESGRVKEAVFAVNDANVHYRVSSYLYRAMMSLCVNLAKLCVILIAVYRISEGLAPVGSFTTLLAYWTTLISPIRTLSMYFRIFSEQLIDAERLLVLFKMSPSVMEKQLAKELVVDKGKVEFEDVGFAYDPRKQTLSGINLTIEAGKTVAFVGETGSGKSTTMKLLYRFFDVTNGAIKIDGQDIRDVTLSSLRETLGVVPQDPSLFNMSITDNLRYAKLDATDEEIQAVCKAAAVHDQIMTFPDGYDSKVGERGIKLSGGELQRVAIARVLLKNPKIVLLDEATSAVDTDTEALIQEAFQKLSAGRTTFVIAHRLSTVKTADTIVVLHEGKIIEQGTHAELLEVRGKYYSLWSKQIASIEEKP